MNSVLQLLWVEMILLSCFRDLVLSDTFLKKLTDLVLLSCEAVLPCELAMMAWKRNGLALV